MCEQVSAARHADRAPVEPHPADIRPEEADDLAVFLVHERRNLAVSPRMVEQGSFEEAEQAPDVRLVPGCAGLASVESRNRAQIAALEVANRAHAASLASSA